MARQIAILGAVLAAVTLSLAYPFRNYLDQRADLAAAVSDQRALEQQVAELQAQQAALTDPNYIREQAKRRLQYVTPGDTVYVVHAPQTAGPDAAAAAAGPIVPWYSTLWGTLTYGSDPQAPPAVDPGALDPSAVTPSGDSTAVSATTGVSDGQTSLPSAGTSADPPATSSP